jgi:transposase
MAQLDALTAAKLLAEIGPIERFRTDAQLARHGGVAPLQASSGAPQRHRLDRGGNRQLNCALHRIAVTQGRVLPASTPLPRTQTTRRQDPTRSTPLPQTTTRTHRLQHTQNRAAIDIEATLAAVWDRGNQCKNRLRCGSCVTAARLLLP